MIMEVMRVMTMYAARGDDTGKAYPGVNDLVIKIIAFSGGGDIEKIR
jgi:hypothetical protein